MEHWTFEIFPILIVENVLRGYNSHRVLHNLNIIPSDILQFIYVAPHTDRKHLYVSFTTSTRYSAREKESQLFLDKLNE